MASPGSAPAVIPPTGHQPDHHRASHEVLHAKDHAIDALTHHKRGEFRKLMSWAGLSHERRMRKQMQEGGHGKHADHTAENLAVTKTADPHEMRHLVEHALLDSERKFGNFDVVDSSGAALPPAAVKVTYKPKTNKFWAYQRNANEIYEKIKGMELGQLKSDLGIDFGTAPANAKLTDAAAQRLAEKLEVPYLDAVLGLGDASDANIGMAKAMLAEMEDKGESILGALKTPDMSAEKEKKFRRKQLKDLVLSLQKISGNPPEMSHDDIGDEITKIEADIKALNTLSPTYTSKVFINYGTATSNAEKRALIAQASQEKTKLSNDKAFYANLGTLVERIHDQVGRMGTDAKEPTTLLYAGLFSGGAPGKVNPANLKKDYVPSKIGDELVDFFKDFMAEEDKSADKGPAPESPQGSDAIMRVYEEYFKKKQKLSPRAARARASQLFFENEFGPDEVHMIDDMVRTDIAGAKLTAFQVLGRGVSSTIKRWSGAGSDEARISKIAEAAGVRFAAGEGGVMNYLTSAGTYNPLRAVTTNESNWNPLCWPLKAVNWATNKTLGTKVPWNTNMLSWPNGINNFMFGTRILGVTPMARWRSRPAWGEIAGSPYKLRAAWDAMRTAMHNGEFTNSLYVQEQLIEVAHLMIAAEHQQIADGFAKMSPEERKAMGITSAREYMMHNLHEYLEHGFATGPNAKDQPHAVTATYAKARKASRSVGGIKRWFFDEDEPKDSASANSHYQAA